MGNNDSKSALELYGSDLTERAREGRVDPVIGRDEEIRRVMQVLSRRSKNNPILIGEPGVGKSAIVEGLAQRIVSGDVPLSLKNKRLIAIDLGALLAGASYKGEFEKRLKSVLEEITEAAGEIVTFIDEIHTLVGAGGGQGSIDAGNMLKPLLARGELRLIGATTLDEFRTSIEKDAALERRFQQVLVNEPSVEDTITILRGLKEKYEAHHKVLINDDALVTSVVLSNRYITTRFLPDKAIDLIDEAASRLRMEIDSSPVEIDKLNREVNRLTMEKFSLKDDKGNDKDFKLSNLQKELDGKNLELESLSRRWLKEKEVLNKIGSLTLEIEQLRGQADLAQRNGDFEKAAKILYTEIVGKDNEVAEMRKEIKDFLIKDEVGSDQIADVVSAWSKIPVGKMLESESERLSNLESLLSLDVIGQEEAVRKVSDAIVRSRVGLSDEFKPNGSFLFLGPTGVGKTELAKSVARSIYDDESALIRIDMSEYSEKFAITRLIGAPPGYIGYEEGGELTEAVRRRPYSVILLDEIEKAHKDAYDILLQILDSGRLTDSQGRVVDFANTIIILTSNLGGEELLKDEPDRVLIDSIVRAYFKPEFLNRLDSVIYFNHLSAEKIKFIIAKELRVIEERLKNKNIKLTVDESALDWLFYNGFDPAYGARPIKRLVERSILDSIAKELLTREVTEVYVSAKDNFSPNLDIN